MNLGRNVVDVYYVADGNDEGAFSRYVKILCLEATKLSSFPRSPARTVFAQLLTAQENEIR